MASEEAHRAQAEHNQQFLSSITEDRFADWLATVAFYRAVHLVEMMFARAGVHSRGHGERLSLLRGKYPAIFKPFHALYNFSIHARYHCPVLSAEHVRKTVIGSWLGEVERLVSPGPAGQVGAADR